MNIDLSALTMEELDELQAIAVMAADEGCYGSGGIFVALKCEYERRGVPILANVDYYQPAPGQGWPT